MSESSSAPSPFGGDPKSPGSPGWVPPQPAHPPTGSGQGPAYPSPGVPSQGGGSPGSPYPGEGQFAYAPPGYPQQWPGQQQPTVGGLRRSRRRVALVITMLVLLVLCSVASWAWFSRTSDEKAIKDIARRFAEAVDTQDQAALLATLCAEEYEQFTEAESFDPSDPGPAVNVSPEPFEVTNVTVKGDVAQVEFRRPTSGHSGSLFLRKESGAWKMCDPAEEQFNR